MIRIICKRILTVVTAIIITLPLSQTALSRRPSIRIAKCNSGFVYKNAACLTHNIVCGSFFSFGEDSSGCTTDITKLGISNTGRTGAFGNILFGAAQAFTKKYNCSLAAIASAGYALRTTVNSTSTSTATRYMASSTNPILAGFNNGRSYMMDDMSDATRNDRLGWAAYSCVVIP